MYPDKLAIIEESGAMTFRELGARVRALAGGLARKGIGPNDVVAIYAPNRKAWVETFYAVGWLGAIPMPINYRLIPEELRHIFARHPVSAVVYDPDLPGAQALAAVVAEYTMPIPMGTTLDGSGTEDLMAGQPLGMGAPQAYPMAPACYALTSGSTGFPKIAVLTQSNLFVGTYLMTVTAFGFRADDVFVNSTPLCHRTGFTRMIQAIGLGATQILVKKFNPAEFELLVKDYRATVVGLVPTMVRMLQTHAASLDLTSIRAIFTTGEACPAAVKAWLFEVAPQAEIYTAYASTEAGLVSVQDTALQRVHPDASGFPISGVDVRIVDEFGHDVGQEVAGEIWVRSGPPGWAGVMLRYLGDADNEGAISVDGWYRTGDVGRVSDRGLLTIVGRQKEMIISGGINIFPREIESVLVSMPEVEEVAVIGEPDPLWGEKVVAYIVRTPKSRLDAPAVLAYCQERLAGFKKPKIVYFVDRLPKTYSGKVSRTQLAEGDQQHA